ncbi:MAG: UvrD-helicase domain-containing protein [Saprospiraceae bacterium]|nr:UvrD-helicase domain-containing protein [Saprospiraceae bacterium]
MHYLDELNPVQRAAVTATEGPVLVIAGPGSGKTRVLTYRIAHLLEQGVAPWEILTLTFTNKAAREMKERIEKVVGPKVQSVWAGTFHSIFARILRAEASKIGFPGSFSIYDTDDTTSLLRAIIKEMNLDPNAYNASAIRSRISIAKSNLLSPKAYRDNEEMMQQDRQAKRPYLVDIYEKYVARCQRAGAMDFDDLLFQLYRLFRDNPDNVVDKYRRKFRYIHVDEFQDTNFLQYAILRRLLKYEGGSENVFVVGDDAQSIYAFRGATIDNILDFEKDYPNLKVFKLEQNYRSTHHIVSAANEVISFNRKQLQKTIWTDKEGRQKIKLVRCMTDDEEARRVADLILEQKNRYHLPNSEIAILYRTNAQSRKFEEHLRRLNVPYRVFGGTSFYQRKEVKDFVAYLRLAVNPNDEEALRRIINVPARGISDATVDKLTSLASVKGLPVWEAMLLPDLDVTDRARKSLAVFRNMVEEWRGRVATDNAYRLAADILKRSGLFDSLKSDTSPEGIGRLENVNAVLDAVSEFADNPTLLEDDFNDPTLADRTHDRSLAAYLQTITLLTDADENSGERDFITLMSTHAAKGLEFNSVFITGLEENLFPSFMSMDDPNGLDEERRLFYVAITRAKEFLTISYAQNRYRFGQIRVSEPSRFLEEIDTQHYELLSGIGASRPAPPAPVGSARASLSGNFASPRARAQVRAAQAPAVDPSGFKASPPEAIVPGAAVLHLKFGQGRVTSVEGPRDNKVATIQFQGDELPERRIVLKFAKLQVL